MNRKEKKQTENGYDEAGNLFGEFERPSYEEWKVAAIKLLKGKSFEKAMFTPTPEGIVLDPIYRLEDLEKLPYVGSLPGSYPYLRGTKAEGNIHKPWDICQEIYGGLPSDFHRKIEEALYKGQTSFKLTLDQSTLFGIDADQNEAEAVGYRGISISTIEDVNVAFHDLVLPVLPFYINVGMNPIPMTALMGGYLNRGDDKFSGLKGILGYDPLGMLATYGKLTTTLDKAYDVMYDVTKYMNEQKSEVRTILVESHVYHNGGSDTLQELAYSISTGVEYLRAMLERGLTIDEIAPKMAFSISLGSNFFMELSKVRALRVLWAKVIKAFAGNEVSQKIFIHAKTSSWTKTVYDPYVNMLRNASEAFSGAIAGVDSLEVVAFDEPIRESDTFSRRVSRNVQSILQDECRFTQPIDPAGGSWYIETLTNNIVNGVWGQFQDIEKLHGMFSALEDETIFKAVASKYEEKFKDMVKRKYVWVGTNMYANMTEEKLAVREKDLVLLKETRLKALQAFRLNREILQIEDVLSKLIEQKNEKACWSIELAIEAVEKGATLGDLNALFVEEHVTHIRPMKFQRGAERFEVLRDKTNALNASGIETNVFLINYGPIPKHKGRAEFTTGFFEVGGFEIIGNDGFSDVDCAVKACLESDAKVGVICATDGVYPEIVPEIAKQIKAANPDVFLVVAGRPSKEEQEVYKKAGINDFIYMGADCYSLISKLQKEVFIND